MRIFIICFALCLSSFTALAQHKNKSATANRVDDYIIYHQVFENQFELALKDYLHSIQIDSLWQKKLSENRLKNTVDEARMLAALDSVQFQVDDDLLKQRIEQLNKKTPFNIEYTNSLASVIGFYLKRDPETTQQLIELSHFYFPLFEEVFDRYDIPLEMKYLAVVESALNPRAKSPVGATGIWQFMYPTGKMFDLEVSSYVDERMDPVKSTEAAAKYLKKLYGIFDDWDLALAAYNSGPGNVNKAIRRSGGKTNYWEIRRYLPRETAGYVPSFQAVMYLFEYAEDHGFSNHIPKESYFTTDTIQTKGLLELKEVANYLNMDEEWLGFLNPSYKIGIVPDDAKRNYYLRLPRPQAGVFVSNEDEIYGYQAYQIAVEEKQMPAYVKTSDQITYRVRSGDFLGSIANRYGVRVSYIKRWNNLRSDRLRIGQRLRIQPKNLSAVASAGTKQNTNKDAAAKAENTSDTNKEFQTYVVQQGDSLWKIARKFPQVSIKEIKEKNQLKSIRLHPGMELKI
ncbi:lytic transglycosylase domain-containing protein [Psychroflexus planctonicus]|uniref:Lytic transglycosylase n=1 Tax=Psychroflexus planctonicus TaxID=1526575 RepID=A0ABQ1SFB9_9FLAO|nr:lytic transglycosylase domain-containing protein [Psychroflexus planctonicus]GGE35105.1 lytic transglycosylase [Psychroflexus planctonicus]